VSPGAAPDKPTYVEIDFEKGNPVAVDGERMSPAKLLDYMNRLAGANGIGRVDMVENRFVGMKSRGVVRRLVELFYGLLIVQWSLLPWIEKSCL